jgi:primosomal replication protein N
METLRYTPGGIPMVKFTISHESEQVEAGHPRKVSCEIEGLAFAREADLLATVPLGMRLNIWGFLDRKSRNGKQLILHATQIEFKNQ